MLSSREARILREVFAPYADKLERIAVFGSRATGTARAASDIDLALYGNLDEADLARLWTRFDESALAVTVDLVDYRRLDHPALKRHIDAVGRTLFTGEELRRRSRPAKSQRNHRQYNS